MKLVKIETLADLKSKAGKAASEGRYLECCILLCHGSVRSSKNISYNDGDDTAWYVWNEIDDTMQELIDDNELAVETNIVEALNNDSLYEYTYER